MVQFEIPPGWKPNPRVSLDRPAALADTTFRLLAVGAVYDRVNESALEIPLLSRGGVDARMKKNCEATIIRADGVVLVEFH